MAGPYLAPGSGFIGAAAGMLKWASRSLQLVGSGAGWGWEYGSPISDVNGLKIVTSSNQLCLYCGFDAFVWVVVVLSAVASRNDALDLYNFHVHVCAFSRAAEFLSMACLILSRRLRWSGLRLMVV